MMAKETLWKISEKIATFWRKKNYEIAKDFGEFGQISNFLLLK